MPPKDRSGHTLRLLSPPWLPSGSGEGSSATFSQAPTALRLKGPHRHLKK